MKKYLAPVVFIIGALIILYLIYILAFNLWLLSYYNEKHGDIYEERVLYIIASIVTLSLFEIWFFRNWNRLSQPKANQQSQVWGLGIEAKPTAPPKGKANDDQIEKK